MRKPTNSLDPLGRAAGELERWGVPYRGLPVLGLGFLGDFKFKGSCMGAVRVS